MHDRARQGGFLFPNRLYRKMDLASPGSPNDVLAFFSRIHSSLVGLGRAFGFASQIRQEARPKAPRHQAPFLGAGSDIVQRSAMRRLGVASALGLSSRHSIRRPDPQ
jgi:hypothetical protein